MNTPLHELTIAQAARALRAKECTVQELWDACTAEAKKRNPELHAYLELFDAGGGIEEAQKRIDAGDAPLLCGIPLAMKDNILIEGRIASAASKMLGNYVATYDATVTKKLKDAGALFIGRTNMDEFALGGSTENSAYGPTKNPHDLERVAGGTSGGSAAAVAAHMALGALGTDTGGSVRNPASYCGVVGLKPTYGHVSRSGLIAAASSFDQAGPIAKTVEDARILYEAIRGEDPLDSTTHTYDAPSSEVKRIGVLRSVMDAMQGSAVAKRFEETLDELKEKGYEIVDVEIPSAEPALSAYYIINFAEVSTNLSRYDGMRYGEAKTGDTLLEDYVRSRTEGFGPESKRRILLGTYVLSAGYIDAYYRKANAVRTLLREEYAKAFETVDVIATPTMPTPAFKIGAKTDTVSLYLEDIFTVTANLTGMPAISVPMRSVQEEGKELPSGIQFMAPHGAEERLFKAGEAVYS